MQINGYQKFGLCLLFVISALSLLAFFDEDYGTQQGGLKTNKKRKQKHQRSQSASQQQISSQSSFVTKTTSKSAQEKQKKPEEKRKGGLDFSFTAFNQADPITREAMRTKTLVSINKKSPNELNDGIPQLFSKDDTPSIVQSPTLLLKGGSEVISESDTGDASSQCSTSKSTKTIPNYALEVGSPEELGERIKNLEEELEHQRMYTNEERKSRVQAEKKLMAESKLRGESDESLLLLKNEHEKQKRILSEQLEREKMRSGALEEKLRTYDIQLSSFGSLPNKLKKSNETNLEKGDGISPLLQRHTNNNSAVMSSLTAAISV